MEMFCNAADIKLSHVPYRGGGPALAGLLGGQVVADPRRAQVRSRDIPTQGKLRVLATFGSGAASRISGCADVPPSWNDNVVFYAWAGLFVPRAVPADT